MPSIEGIGSFTIGDFSAELGVLERLRDQEQKNSRDIANAISQSILTGAEIAQRSKALGLAQERFGLEQLLAQPDIERAEARRRGFEKLKTLRDTIPAPFTSKAKTERSFELLFGEDPEAAMAILPEERQLAFLEERVKALSQSIRRSEALLPGEVAAQKVATAGKEAEIETEETLRGPRAEALEAQAEETKASAELKGEQAEIARAARRKQTVEQTLIQEGAHIRPDVITTVQGSVNRLFLFGASFNEPIEEAVRTGKSTELRGALSEAMKAIRARGMAETQIVDAVFKDVVLKELVPAIQRQFAINSEGDIVPKRSASGIVRSTTTPEDVEALRALLAEMGEDIENILTAEGD